MKLNKVLKFSFSLIIILSTIYIAKDNKIVLALESEGGLGVTSKHE